MLLMAAILFVGICALVVLYAILGSRCNRALAAVRQRVSADGESIVKADQDNDLQLAKDLGDGKPVQPAINRWQRARSETLSGGKTSRPWAWTADDLNRWLQDQVQVRGDAIKQTAMMHAVVMTTVVCLVFGGLTLAAYHNYSSRGSTTTLPIAAPPTSGGTAAQFDDPFADLPPLDGPLPGLPSNEAGPPTAPADTSGSTISTP